MPDASVQGQLELPTSGNLGDGVAVGSVVASARSTMRPTTFARFIAAHPVALLAFMALAALAFALLGYHPDAEDGGIYDAAIAARLDPHLYPYDRAFAVAHTRYSAFTPAIALLTRTAHLPLPWILLCLQVAAIAALLLAAMHLARTCFPRAPAWASAATVAIGAGLPVAGTALYATDPYVTARSLTTPLLLFAVSLALRRRRMACVACWCAAAALHPLMAFWSALPLLFVFPLDRSGHTLTMRSSLGRVMVLFAVACVAATFLVLRMPAESPLARAAALTRGYWFPAEWHWYEWVGAAVPPLLLLGMARRASRPTSAGASGSAPLVRVARACALATVFSVAFALLFARPQLRSLAVARVQPLRTLHLVFIIFLTLAGPWLWNARRAGRAPFRSFAAWGVAGLLATCAAGSFAMQRALYPDTPHVEWPGGSSENGWETAFRWCRNHTAPDALFALPARYIDLPGEDAVSFRAIAQRSALPDEVKDAGVVAVLPALDQTWGQAVEATRTLADQSDEERRTRLLPFGVTWLVLPAKAHTALPCPFADAAVRVCRLTER